MRENIRSRERVKLFFNFIVFSFGVPKPGNYRKFRTCFMRVKISRADQQRKLLTKSLLWVLPTHHECETKIVTVFLKAQLSTPAASSPCVPCRHLPSLLTRRQNLFEINQPTRKVPDQLSLNTSDGFLSRQPKNDVCVVFVCDVLANRSVDFAVVKLNRSFHYLYSLSFAGKESNKK